MRWKGVSELVECPSRGARKQVMVSEPRKGLLAQITKNGERHWWIIALFLSNLKKSRTCTRPAKSLQGGSGLERTLE